MRVRGHDVEVLLRNNGHYPNGVLVGALMLILVEATNLSINGLPSKTLKHLTLTLDLSLPLSPSSCRR